MNTIESEIRRGERFSFGKNWRGFLSTLTDESISVAQSSIKDMLGVERLDGKTFLDIGSGSGLFSLAARNLGASVHSFDYDPNSVGCTNELRSRYFPNDPNWTVEQGSILDIDYIRSLKRFDIVYSWGVLHHTGSMWQAIENAISLSNDSGILFIAIYNDQGIKSDFWRSIKKVFCSGIIGRSIISVIFIPCFFLLTLLSCILTRENKFSTYKKNRGMSIIYDWLDWLGGLPFEVAKAEAIFSLFIKRGFFLTNLKTTNGLGNNQFVFSKNVPT